MQNEKLMGIFWIHNGKSVRKHNGWCMNQLASSVNYMEPLCSTKTNHICLAEKLNFFSFLVCPRIRHFKTYQQCVNSSTFIHEQGFRMESRDPTFENTSWLSSWAENSGENQIWLLFSLLQLMFSLLNSHVKNLSVLTKNAESWDESNCRLMVLGPILH